MTDPSVVLLNDTDVDGQHFGCQRVMATIRENLTARQGKIAGSVKVGIPWQDIPEAKSLIAGADLVVINGEGTLHHSKRRGKWLLEAARFAQDSGAKVALINALWQENDATWAELARSIDYIACRDSRSAAGLGDAIGRDVPWMGDLSMCGGIIYDDTPRNKGIVVGCSVNSAVTRALADMSRDLGPATRILPVTPRLKFVAPHLGGLRRSLRQAAADFQHNRFVKRYPSVDFVADEAAYVSQIKRASLSVTGRFHAVCLAVATLTPFVCVSSNSWKIEALLDDIGIDTGRIVPLEQMTPAKIASRDWSFSQPETEAIKARLADWNAKAQTLFDDVISLV